MYIYGTDEAGYGPNLGPLVITVTVWETPAEDLTFLAAPLKDAGILIADSKKIYHGGQSLSVLENNVLAVLRHIGSCPELPDLQEQRIAALAKNFGDVLSDYKVRLLDIKSRIIEPAEFNVLLDRYASKGSLLSQETMRLAAAAAKNQCSGKRPVRQLFLCDKHGGRNRYLDLLTEHFAGYFVNVLRESLEQSVYRFDDGNNVTDNNVTEWRFIAKGESHLPVALASMVSKYRRETAMKMFNAFWLLHVPGLKPTAGYPEDAKRFIKDISAAKAALGIADDVLWRRK
ncbi:MAG: hypothetical protein LBT46_05290 [Planctomycetaceae bacterium]|jgi:ribonuclease HII|nr:hypothetical protein [Planctomycetaceae bacterium]